MAEDSLPIDIHYNKLLGKMTSHKHYLMTKLCTEFRLVNRPSTL